MGTSLSSKTAVTSWAAADQMHVLAVGNIDRRMTLEDLFTEIPVSPVIKNSNGIDIDTTDGSDGDVDLLTCLVTGTPTLKWDESEDSYDFSHSVNTQAEVNIRSEKILYLPTQPTYAEFDWDTPSLYGSLVVGEGGRSLAHGGVARTGQFNTFVGRRAGYAAVGVRESTFIGGWAGKDVVTGASNTFVGSGAGERGTVCNYNTIVGSDAGINLSTGSENCIFGNLAGSTIGSGTHNTFFGYAAGNLTKDVHSNVFIGSTAGSACASGQHNTFVGAFCGQLVSSGGDNVFIGYYAGCKQTTASAIFLLDNQARANAGAELTSAILYGQFNATPALQILTVNGQFVVNGKLGVGTTGAAATIAEFVTGATTNVQIDKYGGGATYNVLSLNAQLTNVIGLVGGGGEDGSLYVQTEDGIKFRKRSATLFEVSGAGRMAVGQVSPTNDYLLVGDSLSLGNQTEGGTACLARRCARQLVTLTGATKATTLNIPNGARLLAVQMCVNTAVTDTTGDDTWSAAFSGGSTTAIVTGAAAAKQTKINLQIVDEITSGTTNITFTPNGGEFSAGVIEVLVYYEELTAMANAA